MGNPMCSCTTQPAITDDYGRIIRRVRVSVTDRCNFRCVYCMPEEGIEWQSHEKMLTFEEIVRIVRILHSTGITKFRFTGGEPTVRKEFPKLMREIANICPTIEISITTNGALLKDMTQELKDAGVKNLNISLDTLQRDKFKHLTRRDAFDDVIAGIKAAQNVGFDKIKVNVVALRNTNMSELHDFIDFAEQTGITVRFIEIMPFNGNSWNSADYISKVDILKLMDEPFQPIATDDQAQTSREYAFRNGNAIIGFIASVSESFCSTCDRLRVTAEGKIRPCLHDANEVSIMELLRGTGTDAQILNQITKIMQTKWKAHPDFLQNYKPPLSDRAMTLIGG